MAPSKIPPVLKHVWAEVLGLQPEEVLVLRELGPATKQHMLRALRQAVRATEACGLIEGCTIVYKAHRSPNRSGTWDIYIQKVSIPHYEKVLIAQKGESKDG